MVEAATVDRLLETIERRLARLEEASGVPLERYREDRDLQDIVELVYRNLESLKDIREYVKTLLPRLRPGEP